MARRLASARRGNLMIVVAVLCMLAFVGISSMDYLTRNDVSTTASLVRELYGTYLGESIAAQLEARVNAHPWDNRFWVKENLDDGLEPGAARQFNKASGHLKITADGIADADWDYFGNVRDVNAGLREYRVYVEIAVQGMRFSFSWDKRSEESLMSGLNRDASRLAKQHEEIASAPPGQDSPTDTLLTNIKDKSNVPAADAIQADYQELLKKLHTDTQAYEGGSELPPAPAEAPVPPPAPTYDPNAPPPAPPD